MSFRFSVISGDATYQLNRSVASVNEGAVVTITLTTTGVQNGQQISYTISGTGVTASDFVGLSSLTGYFTIQNGTATLVLTMVNDVTTEGPETFTVALANGTMISVDVNDTSTASIQEHWITSLGGADNDSAQQYTSSIDSTGHVYAAGRVYSQGLGSGDLFIAKYDLDGSVLWQKAVGNSTAELGFGSAGDSAGNVYLAGYTAAIAGQGNSFVLIKFNSAGAVQWQRAWGGAGTENGYGVACDPSGNIFVTGYTNSTGAGANDVAVVKYDTNGNLLWQRAIGGAATDQGYGIVCDSSGSVFVTGISNSDVLAVKIDSAGAIAWQRVISGAGTDQGWGATCDSDGNFYVSGVSAGTMAIIKFNNSGTVVWQKKISGYTIGYGITCNTAKDVFVTGTAGALAAVAKINANGTVLWSNKLSRQNAGQGFGIQVDNNGSVFVTGTSNSAVGGFGSNDVIVARLPDDGSKTGTYYPFDYQPVSASSSDAGLTVTPSSLTLNTLTLTEYTPTLTVTDMSLSYLKVAV